MGIESLISDAFFAVLSAPAGFGKTTTVSKALAQRRFDSSDQTVWVELGSAFQTDATTVGRGLAAALAQLGVDAGPFESVGPFESFTSETADRISVALASIAGRATLVFDDFHRVSAPLASQLVAILAAWCDDNRRVIVCTQTTRSKLAALWPTYHSWFIAGPDELRLDDVEIADMLGSALDSELQRVVDITGRWPRAVEVACRCLQLEPGYGFDMAVAELESLILSEVLPRHDDDDLDVLTAVSLCERFTASVADRASGYTGSEARLRRLARDTGLVRLDGSMFSLVPVYRQALVQWLNFTDPDAVRSTYARLAEAWLDEPDSLDASVEAIGLLIDAGEFVRALGLMQRRWEQLHAASRPDLLVGLFSRLPMQCWADDAGSALLAGWANLLVGQSARALELLQSYPLRTPVGTAITRLVWAHGVWWTTGPAEAIELIDEGRRQLEAFDDETVFPNMPGVDSVDSFHVVANHAEVRAMFLLGDLAGSIERLDHLLERPSRYRPISDLGLRAIAALVRAFRGDRQEAMEHLSACGALERDLGVEHHYVTVPAELARAVLASWDADDVGVQRSMKAAVAGASTAGAANLLRVCELVADLAAHQFYPPDDTILQRAARLPLVDSHLAVRAARRLVDLGAHDGAAATMVGAQPNELALSSWVHVLLDRHPTAEVRAWLSVQPHPSCAVGQVVRFLAEATVADDPTIAADWVQRAVSIASDRRLVAVVADAPAAMWEREEVRRLDLPLLNDARRRLREGVRPSDGLRFTAREIELLRLMARSATAPEIAERLYLSVNTVKWHKANIYRKLDVAGGHQAIERARQLKLIPSDELAV